MCRRALSGSESISSFRYIHASNHCPWNKSNYVILHFFNPFASSRCIKAPRKTERRGYFRTRNGVAKQLLFGSKLSVEWERRRSLDEKRFQGSMKWKKGRKGRVRGREGQPAMCIEEPLHFSWSRGIVRKQDRVSETWRRKKKDENRGKTAKERRLRIVMRLKSSVRSLFVWALKLSLTFPLHPLSARLHGQGHKTLYSGGTFFRCVYSRLDFFSDSFFFALFRVSSFLLFGDHDDYGVELVGKNKKTQDR